MLIFFFYNPCDKSGCVTPPHPSKWYLYLLVTPLNYDIPNYYVGKYHIIYIQKKNMFDFSYTRVRKLRPE